MTPARLAGAAFLVLALAAAAGAGAPRGWEAALPPGGAMAVTAEPVELAGGTLTGLAPAGAWALRSDHPDFGGLSGLLVRDHRLYAVTDQGWWFGASLKEEEGRLRLENARLAPMRAPGGGTWDKAGGDAEGLAWLDSRLAVSFERDHRIMLLRDSGRLGATIQPRAFEQFPTNQGLEALATLPDGRLLALSESTDAGGVAVFVVDADGTIAESRLPKLGRHAVTGADVGPDGRLYLVLRHFVPLIGVSARIVRYALGPDGLPNPASVETLASFEQHDGIDNMEGIALEPAADGGLRLWLISDDNFNEPVQRTLLLRFDVTG